MKVKELIIELKKCSQDFEVITEGCDCYGDVESIKTDEQMKWVELNRKKPKITKYYEKESKN